jgi:N-acetylglucosamine malate deacetylase 1
MGAISKIRKIARYYLMTRRAYRFFIRNWFELTDLRVGSEILATMRQQSLLMPVLMDGIGKKKILVIAPHPDDEIMGPGGTLIKALESESEVLVLYLTRGADSDRGRQACEEATALSQKLGFTCEFLDFHSGNIVISGDSVEDFSGRITKFSPEAILLPFFLDDHNDHRRASHLLMEAVGRGLNIEKGEIWAYQVYSMLPANVIVEISDVIDRKADAIRVFASQFSVRDWVNWSQGLNALNSRWLPGNSGSPRYAEMFFVLPGKAYISLCQRYFLPDPKIAYYGRNYQDDQGEPS